MSLEATSDLWGKNALDGSGTSIGTIAELSQNLTARNAALRGALPRR